MYVEDIPILAAYETPAFGHIMHANFRTIDKEK